MRSTSRWRRLLDTEPSHIKCRQKYKRQRRANRQAAHDGVCHWPPKDGRSDWDHAENGSRCGEKDWSKAVQGRFNNRIPWSPSVHDLRIDLVNQNHGIANNHANQRKNAQDGNKSERLSGNELPRDYLQATDGASRVGGFAITRRLCLLPASAKIEPVA